MHHLDKSAIGAHRSSLNALDEMIGTHLESAHHPDFDSFDHLAITMIHGDFREFTRVILQVRYENGHQWTTALVKYLQFYIDEAPREPSEDQLTNYTHALRHHPIVQRDFGVLHERWRDHAATRIWVVKNALKD